MLQSLKIHSKKIFLILSLVLTVPALIGLMHSGFPLTDDGNWMIIRFSAFFQSLRGGEFPVRFLMRLNNGYGYPVADFLYPLFMYLSVPIHILGINFVNTIKILLALCIIASSLFSFLWLRKIFDNVSSLVGAVFYVFFPYHLFDIYQRGSVGEVLSLSILPFILWQIERRRLRWPSLGIAFLNRRIDSPKKCELAFGNFFNAFTTAKHTKSFMVRLADNVPASKAFLAFLRKF